MPISSAMEWKRLLKISSSIGSKIASATVHRPFMIPGLSTGPILPGTHSCCHQCLHAIHAKAEGGRNYDCGLVAGHDCWAFSAAASGQQLTPINGRLNPYAIKESPCCQQRRWQRMRLGLTIRKCVAARMADSIHAQIHHFNGARRSCMTILCLMPAVEAFFKPRLRLH